MKRISVLILVALFYSCSADFPFKTEILSYDGNKVSETIQFQNGSLTDSVVGKWTVDTDRKFISSGVTDYSLTFTMKEGRIESGGAAVEFSFDDWNVENYLFAPCHVYNGNRFRILPIGYAPFIYNKAERPLDMPITVTKVPHLSKDLKDGSIDFRTSSLATPLVGFYDKSKKRGFFILTKQDTVYGDNAFRICEYPSRNRLTITMSAPGVREHQYVMCNADHQSNDRGIMLKAGDMIGMNFRVYDFTAENLMEYFDKFFTIRKDLSGQNEYRNLEPFSSIESTIYAHHLKNKWFEDERFGYPCNNPGGESMFGHLQLGWNGAPAYTLMQLAGKHPDYNEILRRVCRTFASIQYVQRESGLFNGIMRRGELLGDNFAECEKERDVAMISRTAIAVYDGLQCFDLMKIQGYGNLIDPAWEDMMRKACDGMVNLFEKYGEFGQFIYTTTGEMHTPNSTMGALCIGALAYASKYYNEEKYIRVAEKAGQYYYDTQLSKGYVGGSAAEILQSPDSEGPAELTESYVALFEITRNEKWLEYAKNSAALFSSWVQSYDYRFPDGSSMRKAGTKATGAVWASVQNQHGAPGIYVMSGDFLFKIYRRTGDRRYMELCKDMAHNIVQYVNTEGNHIQTKGGWGYCTERVNIGDWEGEKGVGAITESDSNQAWENVALFHMTQNPGIYVLSDKREITVIDHVEAKIISVKDDAVTLEITNPTYRDADVSVLAETSAYAHDNSLGWNAFYGWPKVHVPSGQTVTAEIAVNK